MPTTRLTDAAVKRLKPPQTGRLEYFDSSFPAFGVRVSQTGRRSWILFYRHRGKQRRLTLGSYPAKTLAEAREAAHDAQRKLELGIDPGDEKAAEKAAQRARRNTFEAVADEFIDKYAKKHNRDWQRSRYLLDKKVLPLWRGLDVHEITRRDVHEVLDKIVEQGNHTQANRTLAVVRKLFNWAVERDIVAISPAAGVKPPGKERSRERVLSDDELKALWQAAGKIGYPYGAMYRLLILSGQRVGEVTGMRWREVGEDLWTILKTKNSRGHDVPLTALAREILDEVPRFHGPCVFSTSGGDKPVSSFSQAKRQMDELSGVTDWRNHDLRRTLSTNMAKLGIAPHVVEKVLNHSSGTISGVAAVYNRYGYEAEKRAALQAWERRLRGIIDGHAGNVVAISEARA